MLKVASFFAGIGGFDLGMERAGMQVVVQCEISTFCQQVLKKHWPDVPLFGDINQMTVDDIPADTEVWCGGFPCQDLSLANQGKRKGLAGERSGLFFQYAATLDSRGSADAVCQALDAFGVRDASGVSSGDSNRYRAVGNAV